MAWPKKLTVDKRVISLLSASTYESFPRALRELVSNAHDADASRVDIEIDLKRSLISVVDDGVGMTPDEFGFFLRIAGRQRGRSPQTDLGRRRIGQFGIGFLAMFPFCQEVRVESTIEGSPIVFRARIPAAKFFTESDKVEDITAAEVEGEEFRDTRLRKRHYTRITLRKTTRLVDRYLQAPRSGDANSIRSWPGAKRLRWDLQEILPLPHPSQSKVATYTAPKPQDFAVYLDGNALEVNDYVEEVLEHSPETGKKVGDLTFRYAIGTPWKAVKPNEARGLRIKLHGVGVGERQLFDLGTQGRTFSRLHWLTGEVDVTSGLDEAITLDRDSFTATADYDEFREFLRNKLRELANFVEVVDVARRKIDAQTRDSPRAETASRKEVVAEEVNRLERRGFDIREAPVRNRTGTESGSPVEIDTEHRIVTVRPGHSALRDTISVAGTDYEVAFRRWNPEKGRYKACRLNEDGVLEMNQDYPLFSGSHKDVFRRLQILLLEAEGSSSNKKQLFDAIQRLLLEEFDEN